MAEKAIDLEVEELRKKLFDQKRELELVKEAEEQRKAANVVRSRA